jgi:hypothetical protein
MNFMVMIITAPLMPFPAAVVGKVGFAHEATVRF